MSRLGDWFSAWRAARREKAELLAEYPKWAHDLTYIHPEFADKTYDGDGKPPPLGPFPPPLNWNQ